MNKTYEVINSRILEQLEKGVVPWHKPWTTREQIGSSGKPYRGINAIMTAMSPFASPYWFTINRLNKMAVVDDDTKPRESQKILEPGGQIIQGQGKKWTPIVYYGQWEKKDDDGNIVNTIWFPKFSCVWNLEQCELPEKDIPSDLEDREHEPIEAAELIVANFPAPPTLIHRGDRACYSPLQDNVTMPPPETFDSGEAYYSTLFHELIHATGHESRLERFKKNESPAGFGSTSYSKEELVAEFGAAFLCGEAGIESNIENTASYISSWKSRIKEDPKLLMSAASKAQKAADFVNDRIARKEAA